MVETINRKGIIYPTTPNFRGIWENKNLSSLGIFSIWLNSLGKGGVCWESYEEEFVNSEITRFLEFMDGISFTKQYRSSQSDLLKGPISYEAHRISTSETEGLFAGIWTGKDASGERKAGSFYMASPNTDLKAFKIKLAESMIANFDGGLSKIVKELKNEFPYAPPDSILIG